MAFMHLVASEPWSVRAQRILPHVSDQLGEQVAALIALLGGEIRGLEQD